MNENAGWNYTRDDNPSTVMVRDTDLHLNGDWSMDFVHWTTSGGEAHSLTGQGAIADTYITTGSYGEDISPSNYNIGAGIVLKGGTLKLYNGAHVNVESSFAETTSIFLCDDSRLNFSNARLDDSAALRITMQGNGILAHDNFELKTSNWKGV